MLPVLLAVLAGLLLALGVLGWWCLATMDERYSRVVAQTAASLNQVQAISVHASTGYGNVLELRQVQDPVTRAALLRTVAEERAANDHLFEKLKLTLTDPQLRDCLEDVLAKRKVCRAETEAFIAETGNAASTVPNASGTLELLRSFIAYQQACDRLTDQIEATSLQACRETAEEIKRLRWLFLGVGILPFASALILLVTILVLLRVVSLDGEAE
jgi:hypothetical protein